MIEEISSVGTYEEAKYGVFSDREEKEERVEQVKERALRHSTWFNHHAKPLKAKAKVETGTRIEWGDSDGVRIQTFTNGKIKTDDGYYGSIQLEQEINGKGFVDIRGGGEWELDRPSPQTERSQNDKEGK